MCLEHVFWPRLDQCVSWADAEASFFCGDAAGRAGDEMAEPSDRDFAATAGLPFKTPEEVFGCASPTTVVKTHIFLLTYLCFQFANFPYRSLFFKAATAAAAAATSSPAIPRPSATHGTCAVCLPAAGHTSVRETCRPSQTCQEAVIGCKWTEAASWQLS